MPSQLRTEVPGWPAKARALPRKVSTAAVALVRKGYGKLKDRYGPRYAKAMLIVVFVSFFSPLPGTVLVGLGFVVLIGEIHRVISRRGAVPAMPNREVVMSMDCDVVLKETATSEQLRILGTALWRWALPAAGTARIYSFLDNQILADLIAGTFPVSGHTERGDVHFRLQDEQSPVRRTTIDSLRRSIPAEGVGDIVVNGESWNSTRPAGEPDSASPGRKRIAED